MKTYNILYYTGEYILERVYKPYFEILEDDTYLVCRLTSNSNKLKVLFDKIILLQETR